MSNTNIQLGQLETFRLYVESVRSMQAIYSVRILENQTNTRNEKKVEEIMRMEIGYNAKSWLY